jgi:hypothetical protein
MKKYILYIIIVAIVFAGVIISQNNEKKEVNWSPTFYRSDKIPYGTRIFYDLASLKFPDNKIETIDDPGELLSDNGGYSKSGNLIIVQNSLNEMVTDVNSIMEFAAKGNNVFIAANSLSKKIEDSLKFKVYPGLFFQSPISIQEITLSNPALKSDSAWKIKKALSEAYFSGLDTETTTILGKDWGNQANFIRIRWGEGNIYISLVPYMFTNISMLNEHNVEYAEKCLAYLPASEKVYWYDGTGGRMKNSGLLDFVFSQPPLKYAYLLLLLGLLLYVFFEGKRRQKIIPVIPPLKNSTIEFAETIGRLYFQEADHKNIAEKKISYFYEFLRSRLFMNPTVTDEAFYFKLSTKTGMDMEDIKKLFHFIEAVKTSPAITENDLIKLNTRIDNFYKHF